MYRYIALKASPIVAEQFTSEIVDQCERLDSFPLRGAPCDDLRPGLRTFSFRRRVTIAYTVEPGIMTIIGLFYGGQDFQAALSDD